MNQPGLGLKFLLLGLSIVVAVALTYGSIALPRVVSSLLLKTLDLPGYDARHPINLERTEEFFQNYHVRWIGGGSLAAVLLLVIVGLVMERGKFAALGAFAFFIPVFGHFTLSMFFLAGLGLLRIVWVPLLDISYDLLRLGDVSYLPFRFIIWLLSILNVDRLTSLASLDMRDAVAFAFMGAGLLLFVVGVQAWFYTRMKRERVAVSWLYRLSRHPQYLGWILWSYGVLNYVSMHSELTRFKLCYEMPSSLPWLISTIIIVGVAMVEEIRMKRSVGEEYERYRQRTPFLFPLPGFLSRILSMPMKLLVRKEWPKNGREVVLVLSVYGASLILLSLIV